MNPTLLAREALAERGSLDPRPEPHMIITYPTRLVRVIEDQEETWLDPFTGKVMKPDDQ